MKISTALIDDEPYASARIKKLILADPSFEIVGEVTGVEDAVKMLQFKKPEMVFLDVKMPDGTGFDVLSQLPADYKPYVVFVTAYDDFALKAFEYNAIDYILKPYENSRFYRVVEKAKEFVYLRRSSEINQKISDLINQGEQKLQSEAPQIKITEKGWDVFIDYPDIMLFEAHGNYCKIHLKNRFYIYKQTMKKLEDELSSMEFIRIHRSYIVNLANINTVQYLGKGEYEFELCNSTKVISGRSFAADIKAQLSMKVKS
ncbi:LytR/AlgR family response regulator transcription factor [Ekhidna sp. To15]|uniref:LytR/AlgR family response regulator transcription factor n=1 Tax=Ekhidna sp. To15 TaxID=3395267 RepID=UPI003F51E0F9